MATTLQTPAGSQLAQQLELCAQGDKAALREILETEGPKMLGVARRLLQQKELAEDALQDTLILIWRKAHQFDARRGAAKPWIYAVLRNRCLSILRSDAREIATEDDRLELRVETDRVDDAWKNLGHDSELKKCLEGLQEEKRTAVLMSYVLGCTHGEIAGRLQAPLGTTKTWLRRGLAALRECMS
ncbi:sigma-70 family RNA polymerase sigma factor [Roseibium hamelinense]|uniref:sigma-70 family RNA polymerase sigma factor n=1 Tax=Roseibium hamelinense TaxID=150831 RepID=UPI001FCC5B37|nr:sigma-70 family RNA polymerase sigma factor [Roseibium hamelinense]